MFLEIFYTAICSIVMLGHLTFVLVKSFLNDIISDDKTNIDSKIFIVDNTIPELMLVLKLIHLDVLNLWWFKTLLCVFKPHFISYSYNISHLFNTAKLSNFKESSHKLTFDFKLFFLKSYLLHY